MMSIQSLHRTAAAHGFSRDIVSPAAVAAELVVRRALSVLDSVGGKAHVHDARQKKEHRRDNGLRWYHAARPGNWHRAMDAEPSARRTGDRGYRRCAERKGSPGQGR